LERQRLREDLERLHRELSETRSLEPADRALLLEVLGDIETLLERGSDAGADSQGLLDRLRAAMGRFEEQHPSLTSAVGRIADALAALGV
jgi:hypothetical protein